MLGMRSPVQVHYLAVVSLPGIAGRQAIEVSEARYMAKFVEYHCLQVYYVASIRGNVISRPGI
jgi:hypothetical protein